MGDLPNQETKLHAIFQLTQLISTQLWQWEYKNSGDNFYISGQQYCQTSTALTAKATQRARRPKSLPS